MVESDNVTPRRVAWGLNEVAEQVGVSSGFLRLEILRGKLRATRLGRRLVILDSELRSYLQENTKATSSVRAISR